MRWGDAIVRCAKAKKDPVTHDPVSARNQAFQHHVAPRIAKHARR